MDNANDRYNLVLSELKRKKNWFERKNIIYLKKQYPDNETYKDAIIKELSKRGLIEYVNSEAILDENGYWVYVNDLPKYHQTTKAGEIALKNKLFPSDIANKSINNRFRNLQIIGITIAALGGLITIFSFFYKLINHFFK